MSIPMLRRAAVAILATKIVASLVACGDDGPLGTISGRTITLLILPDGIWMLVFHRKNVSEAECLTPHQRMLEAQDG